MLQQYRLKDSLSFAQISPEKDHKRKMNVNDKEKNMTLISAKENQVNRQLARSCMHGGADFFCVGRT